jgi:hypothetical protein
MRTLHYEGDEYLSMNDGQLHKLSKEFGAILLHFEWCKDAVELCEMDLPHLIAQTPQDLRSKIRKLMIIKTDAEAFIAEVQKELWMKGFL